MQRGDSNSQWGRRGPHPQEIISEWITGYGSSGYRDREDRHRNSRGWSYHNKHQYNSRDRDNRNNHHNSRYEGTDNRYNHNNNYQQGQSSYWKSNRDFHKNSGYISFEDSGNRHSEDRDRTSPERRGHNHSSEDERSRSRREYSRSSPHSFERRRDSRERSSDDPYSIPDKSHSPDSAYSTPKSSQTSASTTSGLDINQTKTEYENVVELANKISSLGPAIRDPRLIARVLKIQKEAVTDTAAASQVSQQPEVIRIASNSDEKLPSNLINETPKPISVLTTSEVPKLKEEKPPRTKKYLSDPRLSLPRKNTSNVIIKPIVFKLDTDSSKEAPTDDSTLPSAPDSPTRTSDLPPKSGPLVENIKEDQVKLKELEESIINECKLLVGDLDEKLRMPAVKSISREATQRQLSSSGIPKPKQVVSEKPSTSQHAKEEPSKLRIDYDKPKKAFTEALPNESRPSSSTTQSLLKESFVSKLRQEGRAKMTAPSKPETKQNQAILQMSLQVGSSDKSDLSTTRGVSPPKQPGIKGILNKVMKTSISQILKSNMDMNKSKGEKSISILKTNVLPKLRESRLPGTKSVKSTSNLGGAEGSSGIATRASKEILDDICLISDECENPKVAGTEGLTNTDDKNENLPSSESPPVLERLDSSVEAETSKDRESAADKVAPSLHVNKARKTHAAVAIVNNEELSNAPTEAITEISADNDNSKLKSSKLDPKKQLSANGGKKTKRRHFRGSTYGLYLSTPKKRKKRPSKSPDGTIIKYEEATGTETTGSFVDSADEGSYPSDFQTSSEKSYQEDETAKSCSESNANPSHSETSSTSVLKTNQFPIPTSRIKKEIIDPDEREPQSRPTRAAVLKIKQEIIDGENDGEGQSSARYSKEDSALLPVGEAAIPGAIPSNSDAEASVNSVSTVRVSSKNSIITRHSVRANKTADGSSIALSVKSRQRMKRRTIDENEVSYASESSETPKRTKRDQSHKVHAALTNSSINGTIPKLEVLYDNTLAPLIMCTCQTKPLDGNDGAAKSKIYCQAIDSIDEKVIGCCNEITNHLVVRPSVKIPFLVMCEVHLWRLRNHQCCPVCGIFCSQGEFTQCAAPLGSHRIHLFHKDCKVVLKNGTCPLCPHCGEGDKMKTVTLELNTPAASTFYLSQKPIFTEPRAKMTFTKLNEAKDDIDEFPSRSFIVPETGKVFSSAGLPVGADRTQLEAMLVAMDTEKLAFLNYTEEQLYLAAQNGEVENVLYMLALGFDPSKKYSKYNGDNALHAAATNGHLVTVHLLLQAGASIDQPNSRLYTPFMEATEKKRMLIVQYLVKCGALLHAKGEDGMSSIHLAAREGSLEICRLLLDTGKVTPNCQDDGGWTPIVWAAEFSHLEIVKLLIERGADITIRDNEENIALHWSAYSGNIDISHIFLDLGCKLSVVNEHGDTPLHIAARQNNYECVVLFLARGADIDGVNKSNETPIKCCSDPNSQTYMALMMNSAIKRINQNRTVRSEKVIHKDISRGKEINSIQCVNAVDDEPPPSDYLYVTKNCETSPINIDRTITSLQLSNLALRFQEGSYTITAMSCQCEDDCTSNACNCSNISFKCWYDNEGKLLPEFNMPDPPMIFECNRACICWKNCNNRVLQHGILSRLQLFRTVGKGWGVRTLKDIPRGTFICEYIGEIISDSEADQREDDSYLFDLDNRDGETYCLDARYYGNISRFVNHLCEPNLVPVKIFVEHQDLSFPRIAFFSSRDIKSGEELGFDYGEKFWVIKYKCFTCGCDSTNCKYSKDTIHQTLETYYRRLKEEHPDEEIESCAPQII